MSHLTLSLPLCGFLGFAGLVLALMALANRVARRSLGGEQPLPMTVSRTYTQSSDPVAAPLPDRLAPSPEVVARVQEATPSFTGPEMADAGMRQRCLCGAYELRTGLLTGDSVCVSCGRAWCCVRSRHYFVPLAVLPAFCAFNEVAYGRGES